MDSGGGQLEEPRIDEEVKPGQAGRCQRFYIGDNDAQLDDVGAQHVCKPNKWNRPRTKMRRQPKQHRMMKQLKWQPAGRKLAAVQTDPARDPGGQAGIDAETQTLPQNLQLRSPVDSGAGLQTCIELVREADVRSTHCVPPALRQAVRMPAGTRGQVVALAIDFDFRDAGRPSSFLDSDEDYVVIDVRARYYVINVLDVAVRQRRLGAGYA